MKETFFLFAYDSHYPSGGANDCIGVFDSLEGAMSAYTGQTDEASIAIMQDSTLKIVAEGQKNWMSIELSVKWKLLT